MTEELDGDTLENDRWLKQQLRPSGEAIERVWKRVVEGRGVNDHGERSWRDRLDSRRAVQLSAAAAAVIVLGVGAGLFGSRLQAPQQQFATSVLPSQTGQGASLNEGPAAGPATQDAAPGRFAAYGSAASAPAPAYYGGSCSQAPTVQLQGRGVTATGFGTVAGVAGGSVVNLFVQGQGPDANVAASAVQAKATAVQEALAKIGFGADHVQQTNFSVWSGPPNQATATAYMQARIANSSDTPKVISTAIQAGASSANSSGQVPPDSASDGDVRDAVVRATDQAKTMATATASAAGVQIAQLQTVVTQPPQVCYGPSGAQRVVAVTISYSLK